MLKRHYMDFFSGTGAPSILSMVGSLLVLMHYHNYFGIIIEHVMRSESEVISVFSIHTKTLLKIVE